MYAVTHYKKLVWNSLPSKKYDALFLFIRLEVPQLKLKYFLQYCYVWLLVALSPRTVRIHRCTCKTNELKGDTDFCRLAS